MDIVDTNWLQQLEVVIKVIIAGCLGGVVGLERELANRPAGLRTHAILASAAALLVGTADFLVMHFVGETAPAVLRADPIRVVEAIVTGVSFLGAGTIFRKRDGGTIEGLTTAASLLLVAAIGIVVALGQMLLAVLVTLVTLVMLRSVARMVGKRTSTKD
jgi:putative Mg2+ transporter-C (MgtC) family protein